MTQRSRPSRRAVLHATAATLVAACRNTSALADEKKARIIDPHVHVWKHDPNYPWAKEEKEPPKDDALPETILRLMKANGVDNTVIVHVIYYRWDCRYAGDVIKANQKQFMGVCRINPEADSAADDLKRWVGDYGFHGVRLSPEADKTGEWINDQPRMDRIFKRAARVFAAWCNGKHQHDIAAAEGGASSPGLPRPGCRSEALAQA